MWGSNAVEREFLGLAMERLLPRNNCRSKSIDLAIYSFSVRGTPIWGYAFGLKTQYAWRAIGSFKRTSRR